MFMSTKRTKVTCLILFFAVFLWVLLSGQQTIRTAKAFSSGPDAGYTGAPGELTCAISGCHGGEPNTGPGQLLIMAPSSYEPGQTYHITVKHMTTDTSRRRWGFQLTALDGTNSRAGDLVDPGGLTQLVLGGPGGNRQYIEHSLFSTFQGLTLEVSWNFNWIAPSTDVGPVTFYAAGNEANGDGNNTGDQIYATTAFALSGSPQIEGASVRGKKLFVMGKNFGDGAKLLINGDRVKKASNDADTPTTLFTAKKAGRDIEPGQTVTLQIVNSDDKSSNLFSFTRPL